MKPNIMIINPHFNFYGGAERQVVELANYLTNHNYRITIFTTTACSEFKQNLKEARLMECGNDQNLVNTINAYLHKFDFVNPHNHPTELFFSYSAKPKIVWQSNEPPSYVLEGNPINPQEAAYVKRIVSKVMVITDYERYRFQKLYDYTPTVNYPGVRYDYFSQPIKMRNTLNMKNNFVITIVGNFTWTKGQLEAIDIFNNVREQLQGASMQPKLVLIGSGLNSPYGKSVIDKISTLALEDDVFINDYLQGDDAIRNIYAQSSVYLGPFKTQQGGWASTFEAISAGVPTVVSSNFTASNLIQEYDLGHVVPLNEMADRIVKVYDNLGNEEEKVKEKAKWIGDNLTWENFGKKYEQVYEELI